MRIQRPNFLLNLKLLDLSPEDCNLRLITHGAELIHHQIEKKVHKLEILTHLPQQVILEFTGLGSNGLELSAMSLVGIAFNKEVISKVSEYKVANSITDLANAPAKKTTQWPKDGYALFNFFHPDPFAYHLFIGNKIKML
jgi:hypothetical protein